MNYNTLEKVYSWLEDEESRKIFDARLSFVFTGNQWEFYDRLASIRGGQLYFQPELDTFMKDKHERQIVLYGAGRDGRTYARLLSGCGYRVRCFCDTDRSRRGEKIDGLDVITPEELFMLSEPCVVIIASSKNAKQIYSYLCKFIYHRDEIAASTKHEIFLPGGMPYIDSYLPNQYFDFFQPTAREVFVDCGAYNGGTSVQFVDWCCGDYDKIFLFEANPYNADWCRRTLANAGIEDYELIMKGAWDKEATLVFDANALGASKVAEWGKERIEATSLDNALAGRRVTYIKMDIEGAEPKAITGAAGLIREQKPRLAISIYHKKDDFLKIPVQLKEIEPRYHFAFRHYTSFDGETVLYAWV